uniref:Putative secreted protein n=1 Tax=Anopheles darlingi TaxID=43151 RepID=A0A2M4DAL7_ANODA
MHEAIPLQWFIGTGLCFVLAHPPGSIREVHQHEQPADDPEQTVGVDRQVPNVKHIWIITDYIQQRIPVRFYQTTRMVLLMLDKVWSTFRI